MGNPAQRKFASRVEFMESIGFRYVVLETARRWELREYVDQRPVWLRIALREDPVGNLLGIQPSASGWAITGVALSPPIHEPFAHALEAFRWWVGQQE